MFSQTLLPAEIVVVDDASIDGTADAVEAMAGKLPVPLRLVRRQQNSGGPATPLNDAIQAAIGHYIAIVEQDDLMLPDKLRSQAETLDELRQVHLVLADYKIVDDTGVRTRTSAREVGGKHHAVLAKKTEVTNVVSPRECLQAFAHVAGLHGGFSNMMFRKTLWERLGGLDPNAGPSVDCNFLFRSVTGPIAWIDRVLFHRCIHKNKLSHAQLRTNLIGNDVVERWIAENQDWLSEQAICSVRQAWVERLARLTPETFFLPDT